MDKGDTMDSVNNSYSNSFKRNTYIVWLHHIPLISHRLICGSKGFHYNSLHQKQETQGYFFTSALKLEQLLQIKAGGREGGKNSKIESLTYT